MKKENVAIIGASQKEERYSYKALKMLQSHNHNVFPVNPYGGEALGEQFLKDVSEINASIDTITLYVGANRLTAIIPDLIAIHPKRVIFNPGTENDTAITLVKEAGIEVVIGCTLVMLATGQF